MNSDLINRQDAIDALIGLDISDGVGISCIASGVQYSAIRAIEDLPSAEPEQKTGEWIYLGDGYKCPWSCSNCSSCSDERTDYCPMCGAKMEGEQQ